MLLANDNRSRRRGCGRLQISDANLLLINHTLIIRSNNSNRIGILIDLIRRRSVRSTGLSSNRRRINSYNMRGAVGRTAIRRVGIGRQVRVAISGYIAVTARIRRRFVVVVLEIRAVVLIGASRAAVQVGEAWIRRRWCMRL